MTLLVISAFNPAYCAIVILKAACAVVLLYNII